jgi:hypothetical protein
MRKYFNKVYSDSDCRVLVINSELCKYAVKYITVVIVSFWWLTCLDTIIITAQYDWDSQYCHVQQIYFSHNISTNIPSPPIIRPHQNTQQTRITHTLNKIYTVIQH